MEINLKTLNEEQKRAVIHDKGPLLIVAGAGTGKTTVITQRIGYLIEQEKVKPDDILALTFTDKAAGEMEERVDQLLPYGYIDLWILTFHSFAEKILHQHGLEIGIPNDFKLLNQTEQWMLVRQNLDLFKLDYYQPLGNPTKFIHALVKLFSRAKDEVVEPADYLKYAQDLKLNLDANDFVKDYFDADQIKAMSAKEKKELIAQEIKKTEEIANAFHIYQQLLLDNNALDFGDLINYCLKLFKTRPAILAKYREKFKYILVDEFQDTNYAQYELVKLLSEPRRNITVVGDDDQSIYKFRGASISNILEFKKDFAEAAEVFLVKNYRSTQSILDLSYKFIEQNNPYRLEVKLAAQTKTGKLTKKLISQNKTKGVIEHLAYDTAEDEVRGVLKKIDELKKGDPETTWNDFAILARTNDVANVFSFALSQTQIPHRFMASKGLYTKNIILDVLAYLRLLDNYHESTAVYRILKCPVVGLSDKTIVQLNYWAKRKGYSLFMVLQNPEVLRQFDAEAVKKIQQFLGYVSKHSVLARDKSVSEVLLNFLEASGYSKYLAEHESVETLASINYLNQFYRRLSQFEHSSPNSTVKDFLDFIDLELEAGETGSLDQDLDEGPEAVKIMTAHAAKGLEFKYVFIVNLVDRRFPTDDRGDAISLPDKLVKEILPEGDIHLSEERRLFYVAMTRAKLGLFFTSAQDYGGARKKKISRFLAELAEQGFKLSDDGKKEERQLAKVEAQDSKNRPIVSADILYLLPKKFSYSQLRAFSTCPYHYWLEYILKIPQPGKNFFSFGSSLHLTLQEFFKLVIERASVGQPDLFGESKKNESKPLVTFNELIDIYQRSWIDDWYHNRREHDEYKENGKAALKNFYAKYQKTLPVPKYLETMFTLKLKDGNHFYELVGKIDRVDPVAGGVEIVDYKTGRGKTEETLDAGDKRQLLTYKMAAEQQFNEKVKKLIYYYLEDDREVPFVGTDKEVENVRQWIITTIKEILATPFPLKPSDCTCLKTDWSNV
ncbi:MAG: UvrD-helicase domain-containing protein [Patescibacteria group bacterium]|nr:UvrD-helicase domain-containing protein [Patescibacteria group bacterium]